jgi:hypothetical protein
VLNSIIPMAASDSVKAEQWCLFIQNQSSSKIIKLEAKKTGPLGNFC